MTNMTLKELGPAAEALLEKMRHSDINYLVFTDEEVGVIENALILSVGRSKREMRRKQSRKTKQITLEKYRQMREKAPLVHALRIATEAIPEDSPSNFCAYGGE